MPSTAKRAKIDASATCKNPPAETKEHAKNPGVAFSVVLSQAIQSGDEERLGQIIRKGEEQEGVIAKTVAEMPVAQVVPFLELAEKMMHQSTADDVRPWMAWIHSLLTTHSTYLSSISNLDKRIGQLNEWMHKRVENLDKLLQLQGKLELIAQQMATRSHPVVFARDEPMMIFDAGEEEPEEPEQELEDEEEPDEEVQSLKIGKKRRHQADSDDGEEDESDDADDADEDEEYAEDDEEAEDEEELEIEEEMEDERWWKEKG